MTSDETARLAALRSYQILDTEPEKAFDDLTLLASQICGTPIALISLVDRDRQWFKSRVGVTARETSRGIAFCAHAIQHEGIFQVHDALEDARFRENPLVVSEPHMRFYTGAPLVTPDGQALGTLCVVDRIPRTLSGEQIEALDALRRQVVAQLELRRNLLELRTALEARDQAEAEREALIAELRESLDNVRRLSGLIPVCSSCQLDIEIPADRSAIPRVVEGVLEIVRGQRCAKGREDEVAIALNEALANAIRHGCKGDPEKRVQCCVVCNENEELLIVVRDPGSGFNVGSVPDPVRGEGLLKESGRGIFLINELMDEVRFEDGGREIRMRAHKRTGEAPRLPVG